MMSDSCDCSNRFLNSYVSGHCLLTYRNMLFADSCKPMRQSTVKRQSRDSQQSCDCQQSTVMRQSHGFKGQRPALSLQPPPLSVCPPPSLRGRSRRPPDGVAPLRLVCCSLGWGAALCSGGAARFGRCAVLAKCKFTFGFLYVKRVAGVYICIGPLCAP